MKRITVYFKRLLFYLIGFVLLITAIISFRTRYRMFQYYSDSRSYRAVTATIDNIYYHNNYAVFHFHFDSTISEFETGQDFQISGNNYKTMIQNGFKDQVKVGDQVNIVVAPGIFYDGYAPPIVAISCNSKEYLGLDEGRSNLLRRVWFTTPFIMGEIVE